jgi:hypothetical protein
MDCKRFRDDKCNTVRCALFIDKTCDIIFTTDGMPNGMIEADYENGYEDIAAYNAEVAK